MVLIINGEVKFDIKLYDLDSIDNLIIRIAAFLNTIPKFIYFPNDIPDMEDISINPNIEIVVINLLPIIRNSSNFTILYNEIKDKLMKSDNSIFSVLNYFINESSKNTEILYLKKINFLDPYLESLINEIKKIYPQTNIRINDLQNIIEVNKININTFININKQQDETNVRLNKKFDEIDGIEYTDFELENEKFNIEIELKNISSTLELFNNIKLTSEIPFATTHNFYKILKDFTPFIEWTNLFDRSTSVFNKNKNIDRTTNIILKLSQKKKNKIEDYTDIIINLKNEKIIVTFKYNIKNTTKEEIIQQFLSVLNIDSDSIKNKKIISIKGIFYFPKLKVPFNREILLDLIMNNTEFSNILSVNESKIKHDGSLYAYFNNQKCGYVSISITSNISNGDLFPLNNIYCKVKVTKADNIEKVQYFQQILSKLFEIYNQQYRSVYNIYAEYGVEFEDTVDDYYEKQINIENKLFKVDPFIFQRNYSRTCPNPPILLNDEDAEKLENEGKQVVIFPKIKTGDSIPRKYTCDENSKFKFLSLIDNPFSSKELLPYIPCCQQGDQREKKGSYYRHYYMDEPLFTDKEVKPRDGIYKSDMILPNEALGNLPENINKMFFVSDITSVYYRMGSYRNKNSFLYCIALALTDDIEKLRNEKEINNYLEKLRKSLITKEDLLCCGKQEMYDYTLEEIKNKIQNTDEYFDPKLFIHILEIKFKCNIFLFTRDNNGNLILPRYIKNYYKMENNKQCVFIFEHKGSKSDNSEYPQCELIIKQNDDGTQHYSFRYDGIVGQNIINLFKNINTSYIFNKKIEFNNFNWPWKIDGITPISQRVDTYGKTRIINFLYEDTNISMFTSPIQPLKLIEDNINIYKSNIDTILRFAEDVNITVIKQLVDENNYIKELICSLGNIEISIPVENNTNIKEDIEIEKIIKSDLSINNINKDEMILSESIISEFNLYKKLSRYIIEYLLWLFSHYLNENNITDIDLITPLDFKKFKDKYIKIDKEFIYGRVRKMFGMNEGVMSDNKLVLKSEETLKRLFYVLRLFLIRNEQKILLYYTKNFIDNFYLDISDFDFNNIQIILQGEDSISKWIFEKNTENKIHDKVLLNLNYNKKTEINFDIKDEEEQFGIEKEDEDEKIKEKNESEEKIWNITPYFFRNFLIDNKIYLAQNINSLTKGMNIAKIWNTKKFNPGSNVLDENIFLEFTLYDFRNKNNINVHRIDGDENDYDIKILGFKYSDKSLYTVLLPLP